MALHVDVKALKELLLLGVEAAAARERIFKDLMRIRQLISSDKPDVSDTVHTFT